MFYSKTTTKGWSPPCHPPPSQHTHTEALGLLGPSSFPHPGVLAALSQMLRAGGLGDTGCSYLR